jgi:hypothetical protein
MFGFVGAHFVEFVFIAFCLFGLSLGYHSIMDAFSDRS